MKAIRYDDNGQLGMSLPDFLQQPLPGINLTVLLLTAIGIPHFLRGKGDHLPFARMHQGCLHDLMFIPYLTLCLFL